MVNPGRLPGRLPRSVSMAITTVAYATREKWPAGVNDNLGQSTPPAGAFAAVSVGGGSKTCGIRDTGEVACWGYNTDDQSMPLMDAYIAISVQTGGATCAIRDTGGVECWDQYGSVGFIAGGNGSAWRAPLLRSVARGSSDDACGIRDTGEVACWGSGDIGQSTPPAGTFIAISIWTALFGLRDT